MTQIVIYPQKDNIDQIINKLYEIFNKDNMTYNLKLYYYIKKFH